MIPKRVEGATHNLGKPRDWDEARDGKCAHLWVRVEHEAATIRCTSAWEPTPGELAILNAGGSIMLSVVGWQPPVAIWVERAATESKPQPAP